MIAPTHEGNLSTILRRTNAKRAEQGRPKIAHVTNHTMRRTFASLMYEADAQPTDVMAAMGHKSAPSSRSRSPRPGWCHPMGRGSRSCGSRRPRRPTHSRSN